MALTLYTADPASVAVIRCSPPSWMARLVLLEKGAPHEVVPLSFAKGEHRSPKMLALNPRGTIPVLEHEGRGIYETFAILEYLEHALEGPALLPAERAARGRALTLFHASANLKGAGMALFAYLMRTPAPEREQERLRALGGSFTEELARWEAEAPEEGWLAGPYSLADVAVYPYLATARWLGQRFEEPYPRLAAYMARMRAREAVEASWPETWQEPYPDRAPWESGLAW